MLSTSIRHSNFTCACCSVADELNDETFGNGEDFDEEGHLPSFFGAAGDEEFSALMDDLKQTALQGLEADDAAAVFANGDDTAAAAAAGSDFFSTVGAMSALSIGGPSAQQQARPQQTSAAPTSADAKAEWSVMQKQFEVRAFMILADQRLSLCAFSSSAMMLCVAEACLALQAGR
jgi:hypothetical protein